LEFTASRSGCCCWRFPRKAAPVALGPGTSPAAAFAAIAAECVDHWRTNEALLLTSRAAPHLHQTRVGHPSMR
jgi:hypothetical protein